MKSAIPCNNSTFSSPLGDKRMKKVVGDTFIPGYVFLPEFISWLGLYFDWQIA